MEYTINYLGNRIFILIDEEGEDYIFSLNNLKAEYKDTTLLELLLGFLIMQDLAEIDGDKLITKADIEAIIQQILG